jgi:hypothetical protein
MVLAVLTDLVGLTEAAARVVKMVLRALVVQAVQAGQMVPMEAAERRAQVVARVLTDQAVLMEAVGQVVPMVLVELREARVQVAKMVVMVL